jgi:hypothetical protein
MIFGQVYQRENQDTEFLPEHEDPELKRYPSFADQA